MIYIYITYMWLYACIYIYMYVCMYIWNHQWSVAAWLKPRSQRTVAFRVHTSAWSCQVSQSTSICVQFVWFQNPTASTKVSQGYKCSQTCFDIIWFQDALFVFLLRLLFLFLQTWKPPFQARQWRFIPSWRPKAMACLMKKQDLSISNHHVAIFFSFLRMFV